MKILFLHGWHSVVGGVKPTHLVGRGHHVLNPALDDNDFDRALATAQAEYDLHQPQVIVGSSRGGAIAMNLRSEATPLVLLCPAWKNWGTVSKLKANSVVLHSRDDEVIPFADSEELIAGSGLAPETLIEVGSDHRLADEASLSVMAWACELLGAGIQLPTTLASDADVKQGDEADAQIEGCYVCDACGEEIVIPLDLSEGSHQTFVEDCPVCCRANTIHVSLDEQGHLEVWASPEQDRL